MEGEKSRLGVGNNLFSNAKMIRRIIAPSKNAFDVYESILLSCRKHCKGMLTLIALGPTATILAYDLGMEGVRAIDIGHIDIEYEWFIRGCNNKCAIEEKYVNEALNGRNVFGNGDDTYRKEIIEIIDCQR